MKKIYNQPTFEVVQINNSDIVTLSTGSLLGDEVGTGEYAPGRRDFNDFDSY